MKMMPQGGPAILSEARERGQGRVPERSVAEPAGGRNKARGTRAEAGEKGEVCGGGAFDAWATRQVAFEAVERVVAGDRTAGSPQPSGFGESALGQYEEEPEGGRP